MLSASLNKTFPSFLVATVGPHVELTSGCIIGASCSVDGDEKLQENTIITGSNCERRIQREKPAVGLICHVCN